jgi:uncharacterized membrane protein
MRTGRAEAFSDGVFAIAITLLVLEIHVPRPGSGPLGERLLAQWPSYAAYVVSFITIGVIWINHHVMLRRLRRVDHGFLIWNLVLLMTVGILPFTTALMADYLKETDGERLAAAVYSGSFLLMGLAFFATNRYGLRRSTLLAEEVDAQTRERALRRGLYGTLPYLAGVFLALLSPYATLALCALVALFYALPFGSASSAVP